MSLADQALASFESLPVMEGVDFELSRAGRTATFSIGKKLTVRLAFPSQSQVHATKESSAPMPDLRIGADQLFRTPKVVESKLQSLLGKSIRIHGRKTKVVSLTQSDIDAFMDQNHIHGRTKVKHKYGLETDGELVAAIGVGKKCPIHRDGLKWQSMEVIRFCNKLHHTVVGGLDKLVQHVIKAHQPDDLMTSIDLDWGSGAGFERLGFVEERITAPKIFYLQDDWSSPRSWTEKGSWEIKNSGSKVMLLKLKPAPFN